ncbi:hypothetical protein [Nonomuraea sp. bgisy101]|uniref:hypothetical protein n=1 Tax=Nonomuraea sp. bgisy101 TaxID=3413784 RepID=UPI003D74A8C7
MLVSLHLVRNTKAAVIAHCLQAVTPAGPLHPTEHARRDARMAAISLSIDQMDAIRRRLSEPPHR